MYSNDFYSINLFSINWHTKSVANRKEGVLWIRDHKMGERCYPLPQSTWEILQVMAQDRKDLEYNLNKYVFFEFLDMGNLDI